MKKNHYLVLAGVLMASCASTPQLGNSSIEDVIAQMSNEEKAKLLVGTGMEGREENTDEAIVGEARGIVPGAGAVTYPIEHLGIPTMVLGDGPAGLRISPTRENDSLTYYCTHFPVGTALASTWNQQLVEEVGSCIGNEVLEYGVDVLLAPALNIHRNPLCGRNFEYYSEDPLLSGKIAAAYVKGVQSNGVGTSVKHFAANSQETNRKNNNAVVSERALREIYLKGFEIVVKEAQPWTVMSSYNYINGTYASENKWLLTDVLRDEWGFKGAVMTDWFGGLDVVAQMNAGNDMIEPGSNKQLRELIAAMDSNKVNMDVIDRNVKRVLELIQKTPRYHGYAYSNKPDLKAHAAVTRQSATEGMVLLKNEGKALPLSESAKHIALFGCTSYDFIAGGTGSGDVHHAYVVSLEDGLKSAGYTPDVQMKEMYSRFLETEKARLADARAKNTDPMAAHLPVERPDEMLFSTAELKSLAQANDVALITLGRSSGEFADRSTSNFNITEKERTLLNSVCAAFHAVGKKVVVILNITGVIETQSWKNLPDAILCAWMSGQEGGNSVADILSGKANPSGKLTMTFPARLEDHLSTANFPVDAPAMVQLGPQSGKKSDEPNIGITKYEEGVYVGYRHFDTHQVPVSYPFGYGLSYTTFSFSNLSVKDLGETYEFSVDIANTGQTAGKEVVQLYVSAPVGKVTDKPVHELRAFAKTSVIEPGKIETVNLIVKKTDLSSFDENTHQWVLESGKYVFEVGASSKDIMLKEEINITK